MGRCPKEDNKEEQEQARDRLVRSPRPIRSRVAARLPAPPMTMLLRRSPLQPGRINDDNIEQDRAGQQRGSREVRCQGESRDGDNARTSPKTSASIFEDLAAGNWPHHGASHDCVDIGVVPHVKCAGGSGAGRDCKNCNEARSGSRRVGATINPTNAVKSASAMTRGLAKLMKWGSRSTQPDREASRRRDTEIAMLFMVGSSSRKLVCETTIARSLGLAAFPIGKLMGFKSVSEGCQIPANCS